MNERELWAEVDAALISLDFLMARLPVASREEHLALEAKILAMQGKISDILAALKAHISAA